MYIYIMPEIHLVWCSFSMKVKLSESSFAHLTIIEKLHRLYKGVSVSNCNIGVLRRKEAYKKHLCRVC